MRFQLPEDHTVRFDYHEHPHGITAVVLDAGGVVVGVGVAKHNPTDDWRLGQGMSIALGRALARMDKGSMSIPLRIGDVHVPLRPPPEHRQRPDQIGRSIADKISVLD